VGQSDNVGEGPDFSAQSNSGDLVIDRKKASDKFRNAESVAEIPCLVYVGRKIIEASSCGVSGKVIPSGGRFNEWVFRPERYALV
ncbi:MAG TPA: hypothetical protein VGB93_10990, partial [Methylovirgula sp.]